MAYLKLLIPAMLLFASCNSINKAKRTMYANPEAFAKECADLYPVKEEVVKIVTDTVTLHDTLEVELPPVEIEVPCPESPKPTIVKAKCPPCVNQVVTEYKTITETKEIRVRDTARETALTQERDKEAAKADRLAKANRVLWWVLIILGVILGLIIYRAIRVGAVRTLINKV